MKYVYFLNKTISSQIASNIVTARGVMFLLVCVILFTQGGLGLCPGGVSVQGVSV